MTLQALVEKNRSYRRFRADTSVSTDVLRSLVDLGRKSASARNIQPLKYILVNSSEGTASIFPHLQWAGYLKDWDGPSPDERPAAYIIVLHDTDIDTPRHLLWCDLGLACQNILLGAVEQNLGGCLIGSFHSTNVRDAFNINPRYEPLLVIALGVPAETVVLEEMGKGGDYKYYRDSGNNHHVPKRRAEDIIIDLK